MMETLFLNVGNMLQIVVVACIIVLMAMCIDLGSGLYKAKQRGDIRSSTALRRTLSKFIMYEGGMLIAAGVDLLIDLCKIYELFHINTLQGIPIITCLLGIFLLVVEFLSVREKADKKTKKNIENVAELLGKMVSKDELVDALKEAISKTHAK